MGRPAGLHFSRERIQVGSVDLGRWPVSEKQRHSRGAVTEGSCGSVHKNYGKDVYNQETSLLLWALTAKATSFE